jgi:hypothetical protein
VQFVGATLALSQHAVHVRLADGLGSDDTVYGGRARRGRGVRGWAVLQPERAVVGHARGAPCNLLLP